MTAYTVVDLVQVVSLLSQLHASAKAKEMGANSTQNQVAPDLNRLEDMAQAAVVKTDAVTPVNAKLRAKLFRPPKTLKNFFSAKGTSPPAVPDSTHAQKSNKMQDKSIRPKSACKRTPPGATIAPSVGVIDLSEDSPLKKKAPKLEPVKQEGDDVVTECPAKESRLQESARGATSGSHCTTNYTPKSLDTNVKNPDKSSNDTAEPVQKAPRRSNVVKQPLCEKRQNGLEQSGDKKKPALVMGAGKAVLQQSLDTDLAGLEHVIAMGFDRTQSRIALKTCGGDTNRAIEFLLNRR